MSLKFTREMRWFRFGGLLALLLFLAVSVKAQSSTTVYVNMTNVFAMTPAQGSNRVVRYQPLSPFAPGWTYATSSIPNCDFYISNVLATTYSGTVLAPPSAINFSFYVSATNLGVVPAEQITAIPANTVGTYPAGQTAYSAQAADKRFAASGSSANAPLSAAQSTNLTASAIPTNFWSANALLWISNLEAISGINSNQYIAGAGIIAVTNLPTITFSNAWPTNGFASTNDANAAMQSATNYFNSKTNQFATTNWTGANFALQQNGGLLNPTITNTFVFTNNSTGGGIGFQLPSGNPAGNYQWYSLNQSGQPFIGFQWSSNSLVVPYLNGDGGGGGLIGSGLSNASASILQSNALRQVTNVVNGTVVASSGITNAIGTNFPNGNLSSQTLFYPTNFDIAGGSNALYQFLTSLSNGTFSVQLTNAYGTNRTTVLVQNQAIYIPTNWDIAGGSNALYGFVTSESNNVTTIINTLSNLAVLNLNGTSTNQYSTNATLAGNTSIVGATNFVDGFTNLVGFNTAGTSALTNSVFQWQSTQNQYSNNYNGYIMTNSGSVWQVWTASGGTLIVNSANLLNASWTVNSGSASPTTASCRGYYYYHDRSLDSGINMQVVNATNNFLPIVTNIANNSSGTGIAILNGRGTNTTLINLTYLDFTNGQVNLGGPAAANLVSNSTDSAVIGGQGNTVTNNGNQNVIAGGQADSIINGGYQNAIIGGQFSLITSNNANQGVNSVIVGGSGNLMTNAQSSIIFAGQNNFIGTVGGVGWDAVGGYNAFATNSYCFVWSDRRNFGTTTNNQFLINATNGVGINTNSAGTNALEVHGSVDSDTGFFVQGVPVQTAGNFVLRQAGFSTNQTAITSPIIQATNFALVPGGGTNLYGSTNVIWIYQAGTTIAQQGAYEWRNSLNLFTNVSTSAIITNTGSAFNLQYPQGTTLYSSATLINSAWGAVGGTGTASSRYGGYLGHDGIIDTGSLSFTNLLAFGPYGAFGTASASSTNQFLAFGSIKDIGYNYKPVFVSQSRGNDSTAKPYRYDLPYATPTNAATVATNAGDLIYILDGGFYGGATAPVTTLQCDMFVANGVFLTNYAWGYTNYNLPTSAVWNLWGEGSFFTDGSSAGNSMFVIDNGVTGVLTNTSITYNLHGKTFQSPTNTPIIVGGRTYPWTNYVYVDCDGLFSGPLETDSPTPGVSLPDQMWVTIRAADIITGSGNGAVGNNGNSVDQTNRIYNLYPRRSVTISPTGSSLQYSFCTFNINGTAYFKDLRTGATAPVRQVMNLNGLHVYDPTYIKAWNFYSPASWWVNDNPGASGATNYSSFKQIGSTNQSVGTIAVSNLFIVNTTNLNPIVSGGYWTNTNAFTGTLTINMSLLDSVSGDPGMNLTNITTGEWMNATSSLAVAGIVPATAVFRMNPSEYVIATNFSSGTANATINSSFFRP